MWGRRVEGMLEVRGSGKGLDDSSQFEIGIVEILYYLSNIGSAVVRGIRCLSMMF